MTDTALEHGRELRSGGLTERARAVFPPAAARHTDLAFVRAEGTRVETDDGRQLLDFASGVAVTNVGHGNPVVMRRIQEQMATLVHAGHNIGVYPSYVELAERLVGLVHPDRKVFFGNSGAEALESAVKLAMRATGRNGLIAFKGGFHGRTLTTTALSASSANYRAGYLAALPTIQHVAFPDPFNQNSTPAAESARCLAELDELFELVVPANEVAALVVEPVQGEGGYQPAPVEFLRGLRERCSAHGIALIFDEIQTGFGRTGAMFAYEHMDVRPDVLVLAKGIANGLPLSAIVGTPELMDRWPAGAHGGTFGGNPVACAAALGVLDVLRDGGLDNARRQGTRLRAGLEALVTDLPLRSDVRGLGLMLGVELRHPDGSPASDVLAATCRRAAEEGLLIIPCGVHKNVLRLMPPTTLSTDDAEAALAMLGRALDAAVRP